MLLLSWWYVPIFYEKVLSYLICVYYLRCINSFDQLHNDYFKAIAKEAKSILEYVGQGIKLSSVPLPKTIMENAWDVLVIIHDEIHSAGNGHFIAPTEAGNSERYD